MTASLIYVQESLGDNEDIVDAAFFHWMFLFSAAIWLLFFFGLSILTLMIGSVYYYYPDLMPTQIPQAMGMLDIGHYFETFWHSHIVFRGLAFGFLVIGLLQLAGRMIVIATTEIAVTDRRLILKRGLIARNVEEMRVENIESVDLSQTLTGRLLNYGGLYVQGTGAGDIKFPAMLDKPVEFRKSVQRARELKLEE